MKDPRAMSSWRLGRALVAAIVLMPAAGVCDDIKDEVVIRCHYYMGEFGSQAVEACIEDDLAAERALSQYPQETRKTIARCAQRKRQNGWAMIKQCVDRDLEAEAAITKYPEEHTTLIAKCQEEVGRYGPARVKECADRQIEAAAATKKD